MLVCALLALGAGFAILIHVRFVVRNKGLWTAWLSIAGCLMMAFNWCFVNFYIVGLHSYA